MSNSDIIIQVPICLPESFQCKSILMHSLTMPVLNSHGEMWSRLQNNLIIDCMMQDRDIRTFCTFKQRSITLRQGLSSFMYSREPGDENLSLIQERIARMLCKSLLFVVIRRSTAKCHPTTSFIKDPCYKFTFSGNIYNALCT